MVVVCVCVYTEGVIERSCSSDCEVLEMCVKNEDAWRWAVGGARG